MSQNCEMQSRQWYGVKRINHVFANKGNCGKSLGHIFITSSRSHFFNKTDFEQYLFNENCCRLPYCQRWSPRGRPWPRGRPRGQILKSLALASRPQVLENWPVLGSRTALFFGKLKFCGAVEKFFGKRFFVEIA